jgi:UDP-N-acetylglucosamine--N-acetylmuramyl-(pentapeptide) pyrophosphoryl-undecaprenol N-acetylglucosamine transferase
MTTSSRERTATSPPRVVIAAGGTGGHIYPGLALAAAITRVEPAATVTFVGTRRGLEGDVIPRGGYALDFVAMVPFTGANRFALPLVLGRGGLQARRVLRTRRADVAVGMGGYASAPLLLGARLAGLPSLIHESGAIPGKANLLAARLTHNIATAFPAAVGAFPPERDVRVTGMPLAPEFTGFDRTSLRDSARQALELPTDAVVLFVMGGSQGATRLTETAVELGGRWRDRGDIHILLKLGARAAADIEAEVRRVGADAVVHPVAYLDRMDSAYAAADVALCRAGAGTVAELAATGLPAILVPYPFATGDHQRVNADELVAAGGAQVVADAQADAATIGPLIEALAEDPVRLARMAAAAQSVGRPDAADQLARWVLELAGKQT